jgi:sulfate permease, SulP family
VNGFQEVVDPKLEDGSRNPVYAQLAITATFWSGVMQLFMGLLKMGFVTRLLLHPVLSGFTSASALIIPLGQLKPILGFSPVSTNNIFERLADICVRSPKEAHWPSLVIGVGVLFFLQTFKSIELLRRLPAAFLVLAIGIPVASLPVCPAAST